MLMYMGSSSDWVLIVMEENHVLYYRRYAMCTGMVVKSGKLMQWEIDFRVCKFKFEYNFDNLYKEFGH